jgi:tRNA pseudouridine13 synthase
LFSAAIRTEIDDFDVTEELGFEFSGDGEHDYLFIEKRAANTEWVSRQLATHAHVPVRDIGYAGMKDRHAVSRQWFSVPRWHAPDWDRLDVEGVRVLDLQRHHRKLRRGAHRRNRFRIVMRGALPQDDILRERLATIASCGVPNYFGEQRFGRGGGNVALISDWAGGKRLPRHKRSIAISAARSYLFNEFLDSRVSARTWNRLLPGDLANLDGSGSVFAVDQLDGALTRRCEQMDIHPAGALFGDGSIATGASDAHGDWLTALSRARVKPGNRSLRLRIADFEWTAGADSLVLGFALARGAFATSVLREIAMVEDVAGRTAGASGAL